MSNYDWDTHNRRSVLEGRQILERTSASLARSNQVSRTADFWCCTILQQFIISLSPQVAIETENTGTEILSELDAQRESLLRTTERLEHANDGLFESNKILRIMKQNVFYNKLILVLIIVLEIFILSSMIYLKFVK